VFRRRISGWCCLGRRVGGWRGASGRKLGLGPIGGRKVMYSDARSIGSE